MRNDGEIGCGCSGVTKGCKGGHLPPGAALWGRQIEVGMLRSVLITKCQMSADANNYNLQNLERHCETSSRSPTFAKRSIMNLSPKWCFKAVFLSSLSFYKMMTCLSLDFLIMTSLSFCHNAFRKPGLQTFRLPYHFIVASQWDGNPAFKVDAQCYIEHAFRAAIKLTQFCYQGCAEEAWTKRRPRTSKAVGHPMSEITKSRFVKIL